MSTHSAPLPLYCHMSLSGFTNCPCGFMVVIQTRLVDSICLSMRVVRVWLTCRAGCSPLALLYTTSICLFWHGAARTLVGSLRSGLVLEGECSTWTVVTGGTCNSSSSWFLCFLPHCWPRYRLFTRMKWRPKRDLHLHAKTQF